MATPRRSWSHASLLIPPLLPRLLFQGGGHELLQGAQRRRLQSLEVNLDLVRVGVAEGRLAQLDDLESKQTECNCSQIFISKRSLLMSFIVRVLKMG